MIVHLQGAEVSDSDILYLKDFPKLGGLYLNRKPITNGALTTIEEMAELQDLDLSDTKITALRLTGLSKLQELKLWEHRSSRCGWSVWATCESWT